MELLFNGSRASFNAFDPAYHLTGEQVDHENVPSWYFAGSLRGAWSHVDKHLRPERDGFIQVCLVPDKLISLSKNAQTEAYYDGDYVVSVEHSNLITVVESLPKQALGQECLGHYRYRLVDEPQPFYDTGLESRLVRVY